MTVTETLKHVPAAALGILLGVGVILMVQGSLAIATYNRLKDCTEGSAAARSLNSIQICLLSVGTALFVAGVGLAAFQVHVRVVVPQAAIAAPPTVLMPQTE
jgi:hypothetical protein